MRLLTKMTYLIRLLIAFAIIGLTFFAVAPKAKTLPPPTPEAAAALASDKLDVYLSRLAWGYECVGACQKAEIADQPYRRIDSNGQYSYGCLQFQQASYLTQAKKYGIDPWENGGIYNCDNQWKVAKAMFLAGPDAAANHWYTSIFVRGLGLPDM